MNSRLRVLGDRLVATLLATLFATLLAGCGGGSSASSAASSTSTLAPANGTSAAVLSPPAELGAQIFFDKALSVSGQQSCATCHVPAQGFAAADGRSTPLGGPHMDQPGLRNTPSLMYASLTPAFHYQSDGTPVGGFFRDGRAPSLAAQATQPFVTPFEMANRDAAAVLARLVTRPYFLQFQKVFGAQSIKDPDAALKAMGTALAAFESEDSRFHPFSSKFDAFRRGQVALTPAETRGFALFLDPTRGNCTACHIASTSDTTDPLFTDFTYDNVGIPRNWQIPANQANSGIAYAPSNGAALGAPNYAYYDMGLCGPLRSDLGVTTLCGNFKVPSLRNVAIRQHYFHNGVFDNLNDVVNWYATRDTNPARWYVEADGLTPDVAYNDLPQRYDANVNVIEVPYNPAIAPTLTPAEINLIVVFLCTLSDGFDPKNPASAPYPSQCQSAAAAAATP